MRKINVVALASYAGLLLPVVCLPQDVQRGPREFARELAAQTIPAGFVVPEADFKRAMHPAPAAARGQADSRTDLAPRVSAFNSSRGPFRATEKAGVVHIRHVDEPADVTDALERELHMDDPSDLPALKAVYKHAVLAIRGVEPEGFFGSGPEPSCRLDSPVHLASGATTTTRLLDDIVKQVPGLAWLVTYDSVKGFMSVGLMCPDGSSRRTFIFDKR